MYVLGKLSFLRTPFGLWRKVLEETEKTATARITLSQNMLTNVTENVKVLKAARAVSTKTVSFMALAACYSLLHTLPLYHHFNKQELYNWLKDF